ncbi:MAG: hypothetical protein ABIX28_21300 [Vicinamibacterales bacterium]
MRNHSNRPIHDLGSVHDERPHAATPSSFDLGPDAAAERRWIGDNPAGAIELSDADLRGALKAAPICTKYASISTTWCDNPNAC